MTRSSTKRRISDASDEDSISRNMRVAFGLVAAYLIAALIPLLGWAASTHHWAAVVGHLLVLGSILFLAVRTRVEGVRIIMDWIPLATVPYMYIELGWIHSLPGRAHHDPTIKTWERALFGEDVSATFAMDVHNILFSEVLHVCYLSYYALVVVPPLLFWLKSERREFSATMMALIAGFAVCFSIYLLFPVDGPRFERGPSDAPGGPFRWLVIRILEYGSSRGTAFPSSHVAASVVATICALRFRRVVGAGMSVVATGLALGAVYGGYHYGSDIIAGVVAGLFAAGIARIAEAQTKAVEPDQVPVKYDLVRERIKRRVTYNEQEKRHRTENTSTHPEQADTV